MTIDFERLRAPFDPADIEWRVGNHTKAKDKATLLPYLTSRAVMKRLDEVAGPAHWRDSYTPTVGGKQTGFLCTLEIEVEPGVWVGKTDGADTTDIESIKGGVSDALKRAAVKWGIGRYLYDLPEARFIPIQDGYASNEDEAVNCPKGEDKKPGHIRIPRLPAWALPSGSGQPATSAPKAQPTAQTAAPKQEAAPSKQEQPAAPVSERAARMIERIERMERTMDADAIGKIRASLKIGASLAGLKEDDLTAYGKALATAGQTAKAAA